MSREALASIPIPSRGRKLAKITTRPDVIKNPSVPLFHTFLSKV
jgi:hypothetical protein